MPISCFVIELITYTAWVGVRCYMQMPFHCIITILPNKVKLYCVGNSIKGKTVLPVALKIYFVCVCIYTYRIMHEDQERPSDPSQSEL